jgi:transposase-like protein
MAAKFWNKPTSTSLDLMEICDLSEEEARLKLAELRWESTTEQVCPECAVIDSHYVIRTRKQWRCRHCKTTFSVTSRTPFADRKISHKRLLTALFLFVTSHKGISALQLKRLINGDYRTSFTLLHKIRDALTRTVPHVKLKGVVEMDGAHVSGRPRKGRRKGRRSPPGMQHRAKYPSTAFSDRPNRRITMTMRENAGNGQGASRTVVAICSSENAADVEALAKLWIEPGSTIRTDELPAYNNLIQMGYHHESVNHSVEVSSDTGVNENLAESYFSRFRRGERGIYHRITPHYMIDYANEMAWREDVRRKGTATQLQMLMFRVFNAGTSPDWRGYSQGHHRQREVIFRHQEELPFAA